jgi:hypothetical protein
MSDKLRKPCGLFGDVSPMQRKKLAVGKMGGLCGLCPP